MATGRVIDLHSHSTASDGVFPPAQVADLAAAAGLAVWALTDHDSVAGIPEAAGAAARHGLRLVPGIELSTFIDRREIHVLGHFLDPGSRAIREFEDLLAEKRRVRMGEIIEKLAAVGVAVLPEDIEKYAGGKILGRPHVARALVEHGHASSVKEAFDRWLGDGKPAFVPRFRLEAKDAIALIRGAGGVATVAHPGLSRVERGDLQRMAEWGLGGVEVSHPEQNPSVRDKYRKLCGELDLVPTAGSDFHGEAVAPGRRFGDCSMSEAELAALEARRP
ncbi:MAG TPA: PHP domain-containing protein [Anaeromyxobacteraceae bacterium]|nr:PHP domain-containing protein [Anaeromyxobacteraceae bacterium]